MKKQTITTNKYGGLYHKALVRLHECDKNISLASKKSYIPFPKVFEKLGRGYSLKKQEIWELLFLLRDTNFIEIIRFKGIRLKFEVKNANNK